MSPRIVIVFMIVPILKNRYFFKKKVPIMYRVQFTDSTNF